jgi:hypothetical protein
MVDTRAALVRAAGAAGIGPAPRPTRPTAGRSVYGTPEWTERVAPRHAPLVELWRRKGL